MNEKARAGYVDRIPAFVGLGDFRHFVTAITGGGWVLCEVKALSHGMEGQSNAYHRFGYCRRDRIRCLVGLSGCAVEGWEGGCACGVGPDLTACDYVAIASRRNTGRILTDIAASEPLVRALALRSPVLARRSAVRCTARRSASGGLQQNGSNTVIKILYVEDNDDNVYMLKMRLELLGEFEVLAAEDGEKGCEIALRERPDIILMDLEMPVIDGWEATRRLKGNPQTHDIPVIALSAHALAGEREKAMAAGCDEFDTKPIEFERLVATVRRLLAHP